MSCIVHTMKQRHMFRCSSARKVMDEIYTFCQSLILWDIKKIRKYTNTLTIAAEAIGFDRWQKKCFDMKKHTCNNTSVSYVFAVVRAGQHSRQHLIGHVILAPVHSNTECFRYREKLQGIRTL